jgi:hypothetical protein
MSLISTLFGRKRRPDLLAGYEAERTRNLTELRSILSEIARPAAGRTESPKRHDMYADREPGIR